MQKVEVGKSSTCFVWGWSSPWALRVDEQYMVCRLHLPYFSLSSYEYILNSFLRVSGRHQLVIHTIHIHPCLKVRYGDYLIELFILA